MPLVKTEFVVQVKYNPKSRYGREFPGWHNEYTTYTPQYAKIQMMQLKIPRGGKKRVVKREVYETPVE